MFCYNIFVCLNYILFNIWYVNIKQSSCDSSNFKGDKKSLQDMYYLRYLIRINNTLSVTRILKGIKKYSSCQISELSSYHDSTVIYNIYQKIIIGRGDIPEFINLLF